MDRQRDRVCGRSRIEGEKGEKGGGGGGGEKGGREGKMEIDRGRH